MAPGYWIIIIGVVTVAIIVAIVLSVVLSGDDVTKAEDLVNTGETDAAAAVADEAQVKANEAAAAAETAAAAAQAKAQAEADAAAAAALEAQAKADAAQSVVNIADKFQFFFAQDIVGSGTNITRIKAHAGKASALMQDVLNTPGAVAFNTNGWIKKATGPRASWRPDVKASHGIYILKSALSS